MGGICEFAWIQHSFFIIISFNLATLSCSMQTVLMIIKVMHNKKMNSKPFYYCGQNFITMGDENKYCCLRSIYFIHSYTCMASKLWRVTSFNIQHSTNYTVQDVHERQHMATKKFSLSDTIPKLYQILVRIGMIHSLWQLLGV